MVLVKIYVILFLSSVAHSFRLGGVLFLTKTSTNISTKLFVVKKTGRHDDSSDDSSSSQRPSKTVQQPTKLSAPLSPRKSSQQQVSSQKQLENERILQQQEPQQRQRQQSKRRAPKFPTPNASPPNVLSAAAVAATTTAIKSIGNRQPAATSTKGKDPRIPTSLGEAIQFATTPNELLDLCYQLPFDDNNNIVLPVGDRYRYQRWSAQLLQKLGNVWPSNHDDNSDADRHNDQEYLWQDERLVRVVVAVVTGLENQNQIEKSTMTKNTNLELADQARSVQWSLQGLSTLAGKVLVPTTSTSTSNGDDSVIHKDIVGGVHRLIQQAEYFATLNNASYTCDLHQVVEMRWASRGLLVRLGGPHVVFPEAITSQKALDGLLPNMQRRVQHLPFDIIPCGVREWSPSTSSSSSKQINEIMSCLLQEIPFAFDQILTRQGTLITERRGTAWVTESGIGPMAYSGKVMPSHSPLPPSVTTIMRSVESVVGLKPNFFGCALCNWYPEDEAAMKYHCDPGHGTLWDPCAVVVAIGDPRRFAFRPNPNTNLSWQVWDKSVTTTQGSQAESKDSPNAAAVVHLFSGDIVQMWDSCNDDFQHAVLQGNGQSSSNSNQGRISIVMKHALRRDPMM